MAMTNITGMVWSMRRVPMTVLRVAKFPSCVPTAVPIGTTDGVPSTIVLGTRSEAGARDGEVHARAIRMASLQKRLAARVEEVTVRTKMALLRRLLLYPLLRLLVRRLLLYPLLLLPLLRLRLYPLLFLLLRHLLRFPLLCLLLRLLHHPLLCLLHHPLLLPQQPVDCVKIILKFLQLMAGTHLANGLIFGIQRKGARILSFPPTALSLAKLVAHALIRRVSKCF